MVFEPPCRSPLGLRGLKSLRQHSPIRARSSRSPLGLRGLKYQITAVLCHSPVSQPSWAAWIEIISLPCMFCTFPKSQPSWAAWIEIPKAAWKYG